MTKDRNSQLLSSSKDFSLPRAKILRGQKNFQHLFDADATTVRDKYMQLRFLVFPDAEAGCMMGFIVRKKLGKAVQRNRVKRLLKEAYRLHQHLLFDVVKTTDKGFHGALMANTMDLNSQQAQQSVSKLLQKAQAYILSISDSDL